MRGRFKLVTGSLRASAYVNSSSRVQNPRSASKGGAHLRHAAAAYGRSAGRLRLRPGIGARLRLRALGALCFSTGSPASMRQQAALTLAKCGEVVVRHPLIVVRQFCIVAPKRDLANFPQNYTSGQHGARCRAGDVTRGRESATRTRSMVEGRAVRTARPAARGVGQGDSPRAPERKRRIAQHVHRSDVCPDGTHVLQRFSTCVRERASACGRTRGMRRL